MSANADEEMEAQNLQAIDNVGPAREQRLRSAGCFNVGDVVDTDPDELFAETSGISASELETIVSNAREMVGMSEEIEIDTNADHGGVEFRQGEGSEPEPAEAEVPEKYQADDEDVEDAVDSDGGARVDEMDADSFLDSSPGPETPPGECENVLLIAGDDAFDVDGEYGDLDAQGQAGLVQSKMVEFGFDPSAIGAMGRGMGRQAVNSWVQFTQNETDNELPKLVQFSVDPDGSFPQKEDFEARNKRALEWADGVCVVANGNYVGMWVNMANEEGVTIRTPKMSD